MVAECRESRKGHTDRPDPAWRDAESLPSVREVLTLGALAAGGLEVMAGDTGLDARVRWVHVSDSADVARLLDGGELLLSTGQGWPGEPAELEAFIEELADAGLSCLVLELGARYRHVPAIVVTAARRRNLALVVLHQEVKFVSVTEAVHRRIIADQSAALHARDEVRTRFTSLALHGAPADYIVRQLGQTLAAPIVLENLAHEVVVAELPPGRETDLLERWEARSRAAHRGAATGGSADDWLIVPVEARGIRWGHLVALGGLIHPAGRGAVLEQGAIALALGRLSDPDGAEWARIGRGALVDDLLAGRFGAYASATARVEAAGVPVTGAQLIGVVVEGAGRDELDSPSGGGGADAAARAIGGRALVGGARAGDHGRGGRTGILISVPARTQIDDALLVRFARTLAPSRANLVLWAGAIAEGLEEGLASVVEALDLAQSAPGRAGTGVGVWRAQDRPLARLVTSLRDDHRVLDHAERTLAPLVDHDLARGGDLLDVLAAMLAHPGNRTAAASASHLSRSVFYQRIALIQDLLGLDLDDGEVLAALHLALLVRRAGDR